MARKKLVASILVQFNGSRALRSVRRFVGGVSRAGERLTKGGRGGGLFAGFAGLGGGGGLAGLMGRRPGGAGGIVSSVIQGASQLLLLPVKILGAFSRLIPGIGNVFSGIVSAATNVLQGLVNVVANLIGGILNAFTSLVSAIAKTFERLVGVVTRIMGKMAKVVGGVALGLGALVAWQMFKGIRENMELADWQAVLGKVFGKGAQAAEDFARDLSLATPFTPSQMIETVAGLGAAGVSYERFMRTVIDWSAGAKRPLEEITMIFQRLQSGQFGEALEAARRGLISRTDLRRAGLEFNRQGMVISKVGKQRQKQLEKELKLIDGRRHRLKRETFEIRARDLGDPGKRRIKQIQRETMALEGQARKLQAQSKKAGEAQIKPLEVIEALASVVEKRFGGMAEQAAKVGTGPLSTLKGVTEDLRRSLTKPWYDRFNAAIIRMNDKLLELAQSPAWQTIIRHSKRIGNAVFDFIEKRALPALAALWDWLVVRDWSRAFEGLLGLPEQLATQVFPKIGKLFAEKTADGWTTGPLTDVILGGVREIRDQVLIILEGLWATIGQRALETLAQITGNIAQALTKQGLSIIEEADVKGVITPRQAATLKALNSLAAMFGGMTTALNKASATGRGVDDRVAELNRRIKENRDTTADSIEALKTAGAALKGALGGAVGGALPGTKTPAQQTASAMSQALALPSMVEHEKFLTAQRKMVVALSASGYKSIATAKLNAMQAISFSLQSFLEEITRDGKIELEEIEALQKEIKALQRAFRKIARARA